MTQCTFLSNPTRAALAVVTVVALSACSDGTAPGADGQVGVGFQLASTSAAASTVSLDGVTTANGATANATADGFTITRGSDKIVITKAQLVVRDVKLKTAAASCSDDDTSNDVVSTDSKSGSSNGSRHDDDDDLECPTIKVGPYLVDMPVTGADGGRVSVLVPEGTYSKVRLTIHKVSSSDSADLVFRQTNPDFRDISVRLEGTYNGKAFIFTNDVNAQIDVPLTSPLAIKAGGDNVTVSLDLAPWFVNAAGGLYNPAEANVPGLVRAKVQNAIRFAFRAFRDANRDGKED